MKQETLKTNLQTAVNDGENFTNQVTIPEVKTSPDASASDNSATVSDSAKAETEAEELKTTKGKAKTFRRNFTNTTLYSLDSKAPLVTINVAAFLDDKMTLQERGALITFICAAAMNKSIYFDDPKRDYGLSHSTGTLSRYVEILIGKGYLMRKKAKNVLTPEEFKIKNCIPQSKVFYICSDKPEYIPRESDPA